MTQHEDDDLEQPYLWDRSGPPDPQVARLERLLGRYRHRGGRAPELADLGPPAGVFVRSSRRRPRHLLAVAAVLFAVLAAGWWWTGERDGYDVVGLDGVQRVAVGSWLETGAGQVAQLDVGGLGTVDLEAGARLRVDEKSEERHRFFLERGAIEAFIWADPKVFQVDTPAGLTVDLGCAYRLEVADDEVTDVYVTLGQVSFEAYGKKVYLPRDSRCRARRGQGPSAPVRDIDEVELQRDVERIELDPDPDPAEVTRVLDTLGDLTLWHLLEARSPEVRRQAYASLAALIPPEPGTVDPALVLTDTPEGKAQRAAWLVDMPWYVVPW